MSESSPAASSSAAASSGYDPKDKTVLVTGANRGIGLAFVNVFLQHGAKKVYAAVRNVDSAKKIFATQPAVTLIHLDLSKPETIQQAAQTASDVEIVVNNAGLLSQTKTMDANAAQQLQEELNVNCFGFLHMAQQFVPILKHKDGGGVFCQINSVASIRCPIPTACTYAASKAAAFSVTQALRQELAAAEQGTLVMSVHPGPIATDMIRGMGRDDLVKMAEPPEQVAEETIAAMKRGEFLVYPDSKSKQLAKVFQPYAKPVIEDGNFYG